MRANSYNEERRSRDDPIRRRDSLSTRRLKGGTNEGVLTGKIRWKGGRHILEI